MDKTFLPLRKGEEEILYFLATKTKKEGSGFHVNLERRKFQVKKPQKMKKKVSFSFAWHVTRRSTPQKITHIFLGWRADRKSAVAGHVTQARKSKKSWRQGCHGKVAKSCTWKGRSVKISGDMRETRANLARFIFQRGDNGGWKERKGTTRHTRSCLWSFQENHFSSSYLLFFVCASCHPTVGLSRNG